MIFRLAFFSIFIVAGVLAFYFLTRKRWDWSGYSGSLAIALIAIFLIPVGMFTWVSYENRLKVLDSLDGIQLNTNSAEATYLKGEPVLKVNQGPQRVLWRYDNLINPGNFTDLIFEHDKVVEISFVGDCKFCSQVNGFGVGAPLEDILKRFGESQNITHSEDNSKKRLNYPEYQVFYVLEKNQVVSQGVYQTTGI